MIPAPAPDRAPATSELVTVLIALRAVMAEERRAVAGLDLAAIEELTAQKQVLAEQLTRLHAAGRTPSATEVRAIVAARIEVGASASLVNVALEAVAVVLGYEAPGPYDRQARRYARSRPLRVVAL